ncbi:hypothetical protein GGF31_005720 [Allomyces arbusculus]|nr:hypothetical protein GGF31_005720 [Allomyces arbusculus]
MSHARRPMSRKLHAAVAITAALLALLVATAHAFAAPAHSSHGDYAAHGGAVHAASKGGIDDDDIPPYSRDFYFMLGVIVVLVLAGGLFAGLTLGLLSLDLMSLEVLEQSGQEKERIYARKIKPIRKQGHWLLVTLLLANVIVNETLPILTDSIWGGGWPAVVISTTLIVIFGEIIPQAVCSRYGLAVGANCAWFVRALMWILSPIAYPISKLLDWILGETEGMTYKRAELKALVSLHEQSEAHFGPLTNDEVTIIQAVLDLRDKDVQSIMTPLEATYMVEWDQVLDERKVHELVEKGHSRVPVYAGSNRKNIIGMLLVKKLVTYDPANALKVRDFAHAIMPVPVLAPNVACFDILNLFQEGRSHMAVVVNDDEERIHAAALATSDPYSRPVLNVLGIVTLEDVIEELIGEEIIDETDVYVDMRRQVPVPRRFKSPRIPASAAPGTPRLTGSTTPRLTGTNGAMTPRLTPRLAPTPTSDLLVPRGPRRSRSTLDALAGSSPPRAGMRIAAAGPAAPRKQTRSSGLSVRADGGESGGEDDSSVRGQGEDEKTPLLRG